MAKIKLEADPTFAADVPVPIPGAGTTDVKFIFKHRTRDAVNKWIEESKDFTEAETIRSVATGWELDDPFNDESIEKLCQNYAGAGLAVIETYFNELRGARAKN